MPCLVAANVLLLAGYDATHPQATAALDYAEKLIEGYTDVLWGLSSAEAFTTRLPLNSKSYLIPLPVDVESVTDVLPDVVTTFGAGHSFEIGPAGLELIFTGSNGTTELKPWNAGTYTITGTRGFLTDETPTTVEKAASLLAAHYLQLSDPEQAYDQLYCQDLQR